jgi:hypothetical protein
MPFLLQISPTFSSSLLFQKVPVGLCGLQKIINDALMQAKSVDVWIYKLINELKELKHND